MQRRVRDWRATRGPDKEVFFEQVHEADHEAGLDFTCVNSLKVTIEGQWLRHLLLELVLVHSTWTWACVAFSETFEALIDGLQRALWTLGGVPRTLVMDNMSAATHELKQGTGRTLNRRFADVCEHLGLERVRRINPGHAHENGEVENRHSRTKKQLKQALVLRGSRDFASLEDDERFIHETLEHAHNRHIQAQLHTEQERLAPLPSRPVPSYTVTTPKVRKWSTIRVRGRVYSVASRLIGHQVEVRLHPNVAEMTFVAVGSRGASSRRLGECVGRRCDHALVEPVVEVGDAVPD
ncbi:MAG: hypothetical protein AAGF11_43640 [Myxococcota bacterium]